MDEFSSRAARRTTCRQEVAALIGLDLPRDDDKSVMQTEENINLSGSVAWRHLTIGWSLRIEQADSAWAEASDKIRSMEQLTHTSKSWSALRDAGFEWHLQCRMNFVTKSGFLDLAFSSPWLGARCSC